MVWCGVVIGWVVLSPALKQAVVRVLCQAPTEPIEADDAVSPG